MTGVILVIDELIDQGIIMQLEPTIILQRISSKDVALDGNEQPAPGGGLMGMFGGGQAQESNSMFSSIFASARGQVSKTLAL